MRTRTTAAGVIAALLLGWAPAAHALLQRDQDRTRSGVLEGQSIDTTFRMEKGGVVDLEATAGTMIVTGSSNSDVRIRASSSQGRVRLRASSTLASLRTTAQRGNLQVRYEVAVPAGVRVLLQTTAGELSVTGVRGDVEIESVSGNIKLVDLSGAVSVETIAGLVVASGLTGGVNIETTSGDITVTGAEGEISVESTSGSVILGDIRSALVSAESMSGNVRYQGSVEPNGRYDFSSHSGTIRLALPPTASALLTLSTYSGSIDSEFPITLQQRSSSGDDDKEMQFRLGSGSARLNAESFSGRIIITRGTARDRQE